jgi:hypothetical protein
MKKVPAADRIIRTDEGRGPQPAELQKEVRRLLHGVKPFVGGRAAKDTGHAALESTFADAKKQAEVALDATARKITSSGAKGLVKRFVLRNPTMEVIAKAKAKE